MAVKVRCSGCEKVLNAPDTARGKAVRCPQCGNRVAVPAEKAKASAKAGAGGEDSDAFLASMDLSRLEDREAKVCPKCGADVAEGDTECVQCGVDLVTGGLGATARKRQLKGPDPDKYYETLWRDGWKFVVKHVPLAWRTVGYLAVASLIALISAWMYLWNAMWPPRAFFALLFVVAVFVIPGWLILVDMTTINLALEKKDKIKKLNFDFFMSSALGLQLIAWHLVVALPLLIVPIILLNLLGDSLPPMVNAGILGACYLPVLTMLPISISHNSMPVTYPGWLVWKLVPAWSKLIAPIALMTAFSLTALLPSMICWGVIGAVSGPSVVQFVDDMEFNTAQIRLERFLEAQRSTKKSKKGAPAQPEKEVTVSKLRPVKYTSIILPVALWFVSIIPLGFAGVFMCRLNGQLAYYFRDAMGLIGQAKEVKYVAKLPRNDDETEDKPRTTAQDFVDALATVVICAAIGGIGGMMYGTFNDEVGFLGGVLIGVFYGASLASLTGCLMMIGAAFGVGIGWGLLIFVPLGVFVFVAKHWTEGRKAFFVLMLAWLLSIVMTVLAVAGLFALPAFAVGETAPAPGGAAPAPGAAAPGGVAVPAVPVIPPGGGPPAVIAP